MRDVADRRHEDFGFAVVIIVNVPRMRSRDPRPVLAASDGVVATPSIKPVAAQSAISLGSALSMNSFMACSAGELGD
jgi:hypothetical protein